MFKFFKLLFVGLIVTLLATPVQAGYSALEIEWLPVPTATGYRIFYGEATDDKRYSIDVGQAIRWTVPGLECGETYYFEVKAYNVDGEHSPPTQTVESKMPDCAPQVVLPEGWETMGIWIVPIP